jgi:hypothetical protein
VIKWPNSIVLSDQMAKFDRFCDQMAKFDRFCDQMAKKTGNFFTYFVVENFDNVVTLSVQFVFIIKI